MFDTASWESRAIISIEGDDDLVRGIFLSEERLGAFRSHNPLQVHDTATFELVEVLDAVGAITPDVSIAGGLIAVHSNETLLGYLHDLESGSQLDVLGQQEGFPSIPFGVSLSADGGMVAYATNRVLVWDVVSGEQTHRLTAGAGSTNAVFSNDGARLYSAHEDGSVRVWNLASGASVLDSKATFPSGSFINSNSFRIGTQLGTMERFEFAPEFVAYMEVFSTTTGEIIAPPLVTDRPGITLPNDLVVVLPLDSEVFQIVDPLAGNAQPIGPSCLEVVCDVVRSATGNQFAIVSETDGSLQWDYFDADTGEPVGTETFDQILPLPVAFGDDWVLTGNRSHLSILDRVAGVEFLRRPVSAGRSEL